MFDTPVTWAIINYLVCPRIQTRDLKPKTSVAQLLTLTLFPGKHYSTLSLPKSSLEARKTDILSPNFVFLGRRPQSPGLSLCKAFIPKVALYSKISARASATVWILTNGKVKDKWSASALRIVPGTQIHRFYLCPICYLSCEMTTHSYQKNCLFWAIWFTQLKREALLLGTGKDWHLGLTCNLCWMALVFKKLVVWLAACLGALATFISVKWAYCQPHRLEGWLRLWRCLACS